MSTELDRLRVVLVATRNPLNIGAAARAMSNFGFLNLRVVNPYQVAFREARSAVGASQLLAEAEEFKSLADAVADCTLVVGTTAVGQRDLQHPVRRLEDGARLIRKRLGTDKVALLFGSERVGLSRDDFGHCQWLMRIPTRQEHRSMNLGQAVAICLYELVRSAKAVKGEKRKTATAGEVEKVTTLLLEALHASWYVSKGTEAPTEQKMRRLMRRMNLQPEDAHIWLGIFRQILWKFGPGTKKD